MNTAHLHLMLTHIPIVGSIIGILTLITGMYFKDSSVKRTALGILIFSAAFAIPAYLTGDDTGEIVKKIPGVSANLVDAHEDIASVFFWIMCATGLLSLFALYSDIKTKPIKKILYSATLALSVVALVFAIITGATGGKIIHSEIRNTTQQATTINQNITPH